MIVASLATQAQLPDWVWARGANGGTGDIAHDVAMDPWGYTLVAGIYTNTLDLDGILLSGSGGTNAFVGKLDAAGSWIWARSIGGAGGGAFLVGITVDADGSVYVTGSYEGTVDVGGQILQAVGAADALVAKLDSAGNWLWAASSSGVGEASGRSISLDGSGFLYAGGLFYGDEVFGSDAIQTGAFSSSFIARLDTSGALQWAHALRATDHSPCSGIAATDSGGVLMVGNFSDTLFVAQDTLVAGSTGKAYVVLVDVQGVETWGIKTAGSSGSIAYDVAVDDLGRIYVVGILAAGTAELGDTTFVVTDSGDGCIARLSPNGVWVWTLVANGPGHESINEVAVLPDGRLVVCGSYANDSCRFDNTVLPNRGSIDGFVAGCTPGGQWLMALSGGGAGDDQFLSIATSGTGAIGICGLYSDTASFGNTDLIAGAGRDLLVAKIDVLGTAVPSASSIGYAPWLLQDATALILNGLSEGPTNVSVFDATGRLVHLRAGTAINGSLTLGALDLSAGAFLVQVQQDEQRATLKLVVR